jgi:protein SCO1/2
MNIFPRGMNPPTPTYFSAVYLLTLFGLACAPVVTPVDPPSTTHEAATKPSATVGPPPSPDPNLELSALPTDSLYLLPVPTEDAHGVVGSLDRHRGSPVIISMFYASCPTACPMLITEIKTFLADLSPAERSQLQVVLVTLDPARDTPEALQAVFEKHQLDPSQWTILRTPPNEVRTVAAALGIRYRPAPDGQMNHSTLLTLLDPEGRPVARTEGLGRDQTPLRDALRSLPTTRRSQ